MVTNTNLYCTGLLTLIISWSAKTVQEFLYEITHIFEMTVNDLFNICLTYC